jgi:hypothetical protein
VKDADGTNFSNPNGLCCYVANILDMVLEVIKVVDCAVDMHRNEVNSASCT